MTMEMQRGENYVDSLLDTGVDTKKAALVDIGTNCVIGLFIPTLDAVGNVTFEVAQGADDTPVALKASSGVEFAIVAGAGGFAISTDDLTPLAGYRYIRPVTAAVQAANRTFRFTLKA